MDLSNEANDIDAIGGERRKDRRYEMRLDLRWKLIHRRRVFETGVGHTVDLSSGGIFFDPGRELPLGLNVELSISWPALLCNVAPMQLLASGRVVRSGEGGTALTMAQHEFRTAGGQAGQRSTTPGAAPRAPSVMVANGGSVTGFIKQR
jgi:PilZ domain